MSNNKKEIDELLKIILIDAFADIESRRDLELLKVFTDEELTNELASRTPLGKELE